MTGLYLTDMPTHLNPTGVQLGWQDGWQNRSRSSGGYQFGGPWCVMWHHTAGSVSQSAWDAANYGSNGSDSRPIANAYIDDTGLCVIAAAGCTNTNGKGGPWRLPDGRTVPLDDMNRYAFGIEICNNGVGEPYSKAQIDACFKISNAIAKGYIFGRYNNVCEHVNWAPGRKIDPATAAAVQGGWHPSSINANGTWELADLQAECLKRGGGSTPPPVIPPEEDDDMANPYILINTIKGDPEEGGQIIVEAAGLRTCGGAESNYFKMKKWDFYAITSKTEWTMLMNHRNVVIHK